VKKSLQERYEELRHGIPEFPFEREWPDRMRTWEGFVSAGPMVAKDLRGYGDAEEAARLQAMCPDLAALVLEAYPPKKAR
jgi:hypothetical protein